MPITFQILGLPGRDNALLVRVDLGQAISRLLFDCGEGCLRDVPVRDLQAIECLCFSHFHIDHVGGFDAFFRHNFDRADAPVRVFGPADTIQIMHHRLCGVTWNMVANVPGEYEVTAIAPNQLTTAHLRTCEGFAQVHRSPPQPWSRTIYQREGFRLEAMILDHGTPSIAYQIHELPHRHINVPRMQQLECSEGPWLRQLKDPSADPDQAIDLPGRRWTVGQLQRELLVETPGDRIAYLTDFCVDEVSEQQLIDWLDGCRTVVCENNFRNADRDLAQRSRHMVSADVGRIASRAHVADLIVIHVSDRYLPHERDQQLAEVRAAFPAARFPDHWT